MHSLDFFHRANAEYIERMQAQYDRDPESLSGEWKAFFAGFEAADPSPPTRARSCDEAPDRLAQGVADLVHSYRELGHCVARLDPLGHHGGPHPLLALNEFGFSRADLDRQIRSSAFLGPPGTTLRSLIEQLQATYCGS